MAKKNGIKLTMQEGKGFKKCIGKKADGKPMIWWLGSDRQIAELLALRIAQRWEAQQQIGYWFDTDIEQLQAMKADAYRGQISTDSDPFKTVTVAQYQEAKSVGATIVGEIQTIAQAITAFKEYEVNPSSRSDGWKIVLCGRVDSLELPDMLLSGFGYEQINQAIERQTKLAKDGKRAYETSVNLVRSLRQFVQWLNRTDKTAWKATFDWQDLFELKIKALKLRGNAKTKGNGNGNELGLTLDVLGKFWTETTNKRQRLYMLLALNCGFTQTDVATLCPEHICFDAPTRIERHRSKTEVFGRWLLWPETVAALKEELATAKETAGTAGLPADQPFLKTQDGNPLVWYSETQRLDNIGQAWFKLQTRCGFKGEGYAYKQLRKTGSQHVRNIGGKELAEAYLAHSDSGTGKFYNGFNDWQRLDAAITELRVRLVPALGEIKAEQAK